jgi:hypothetical protein
MKASRFPICGSDGNGIRYGRIRAFKKSWRDPNQRLRTIKDRHEPERRLQIASSPIAPRPKPARLLVSEYACRMHSVENSVTIRRLGRSSLQRLHRYENLQSSQIPESVAGFALSWLCAIQFRLCSRRRSGKQFFTASRTSWRRRRTLWTWRRTRTGREIRSAESLRFAVPGSGRVATKFRPALWQRAGWDRSVSAGKAADAKSDGQSNQEWMPNRAGNVSGDVILRMTDRRKRNNHEVHEQEY